MRIDDLCGLQARRRVAFRYRGNRPIVGNRKVADKRGALLWGHSEEARILHH
jgi:hypothetical protein